jgi:hypothetical protein
MPGCVLRVESATTDVEPLVTASGLHPIVIHRRGQPKVSGARILSRTSGFNVEVSGSAGGIENQARDAVRFLKRHETGLQRLRHCRCFKAMTLDFGLYDRATAMRPWPSYRLPRSLIQLAAKHAIEIQLSFYGPVKASSRSRMR